MAGTRQASRASRASRAGTGTGTGTVCCAPVLEAPLDEAEAATTAAAFAALADPVRLRLLGLLAAAENGEVCACDLVGPAGRSQPTVSHHLRVLHEAGLVRREKRGTWVWYSVVAERLEEMRRVLAPRPDPCADRAAPPR